MLKNIVTRHRSRTPQIITRKVCVQCQVRLQHAAAAQSISDEFESAEKPGRFRKNRATLHPKRQPRTYITGDNRERSRELEFRRNRRPRSTSYESASKKFDLEKIKWKLIEIKYNLHL